MAGQVSASRPNLVLSVKDFGGGAVGNGIADDTTAIQSTLDAAGRLAALGFGATVFFPPGIYKTTASLAVKANDIIIQGNNATIAYYGTSGAAIDGLAPGASVLSYPVMCVIQDLSINLMRPSTYTVLGTTGNGVPIVVTVADTIGLVNGATVWVSGVLGNTAANGIKTISNVTATTFQLSGANGNGSYGGNGVVTTKNVYSIASSTNTTGAPIQITVSDTTGLADGDIVAVSGSHGADGTWMIRVVSGTVIELVNSDGQGTVGGAGGLVTPTSVGLCVRFSTSRFRNLSVATFAPNQSVAAPNTPLAVFAPGQVGYLLPGAAKGTGPFSNLFSECFASGHGVTYQAAGVSTTVTVDGAPASGAYPVRVTVTSIAGSTVNLSYSLDGGATYTALTSITQNSGSTVTRTLGASGLTAHFPSRTYVANEVWGVSSGQCGAVFTAAYSRGPNANRIHGGHFSGFETAWRILGGGNCFYDATVEATTGQAFYVQHPTSAGGANAIAFYGAYLETVGLYGFTVGSNATDTAIYDPAITGVTVASYSDSGTRTRIFGAPTVQLPDVAATSLTSPSVVATTALTVGSVASAASTGGVRLPNSSIIKSRDKTGSSDVSLIYLDGSNEVGIGGISVANVQIAAQAGSAGGYVGFVLANVPVLTFGAAGGGDNVMYLANAGTTPSSNPSGGGFLYVQGGAGKWLSPSGTSTTFGAADPHCPRCGRDFALEWQNQARGEHLAVCVPCLLGALAKAGVATSEFAIVDELEPKVGVSSSARSSS